MPRISLRPGASLKLATRIGAEPYSVTVVSAGPHTVRYHEQDRVVRSMARLMFLKQAHAARGLEYQKPKIKGSRIVFVQPMGGQPGYKRR